MTRDQQVASPSGILRALTLHKARLCYHEMHREIGFEPIVLRLKTVYTKRYLNVGKKKANSEIFSTLPMSYTRLTFWACTGNRTQTSRLKVEVTLFNTLPTIDCIG